MVRVARELNRSHGGQEIRCLPRLDDIHCPQAGNTLVTLLRLEIHRVRLASHTLIQLKVQRTCLGNTDTALANVPLKDLTDAL
ncbi:hypothetical protein E2C01_020203 [Portunus trituberculatus]|uniref:Uncharacterized protein n=1 Tax=Portunus trituberculatus TaxID=210409 RepID=A0A5B7DZB7_PORTR|nr:hypothetical protein [Portunus trituberculatus]